MIQFGGRVYHIVLVCVLHLPQEAFFTHYPTIFWTPNNCRFNLNKPGSTEPFIYKVKPNSHLYFVCPNVALCNDICFSFPVRSRMYENLWAVDKHGYDTCTVDTNRNPKLNRLIFRCDQDSQKLTYTEEIFSPYQAFKEKMTYSLGKTYYFISTSDGTMESLNSTSGGHCTTHHMKLQIYVCRLDEPCYYEMPKCPYSAFNKETTTTSPSTAQSTKQITPRVIPTNATGSVPATSSSNPASKSPSTTRALGERQVLQTDIVWKTTTESSETDMDALSSQQTIWGPNRKHIIIHITMALLILVLVLCLIYVLVTRRKITKPAKPEGINSELYKQRPMSLIPLESEVNGQSLPASV